MNRKNLIGDVAGWWKRVGGNRPSIYFACDVAHALSIRDELRSQGVTAEMICDETPDEERSQIKKESERGNVQVVVNCDVLAEGIDWPHISCIGLVRPTKRLRRYLQNAGRGMRACAGKENCLIIDHAGCVLYHGFPDLDREWPLASTDNIDKQAEEKKKLESPIQRCAECSAMFSGTRTCPECGHVHAWQKAPKDYAQRNGTLVEVAAGELPEDTQKVLMNRYWKTCIAVAIKRRAKAGMAAGMFSAKFGIPPWQAGVNPLPKSSDDWKRPSWEVWPGFVRKKDIT